MAREPAEIRLLICEGSLGRLQGSSECPFQTEHRFDQAEDVWRCIKCGSPQIDEPSPSRDL